MVTLYDVVDTRTGQWYSVVVCKRKNAKWFVPADQWIED